MLTKLFLKANPMGNKGTSASSIRNFNLMHFNILIRFPSISDFIIKRWMIFASEGHKVVLVGLENSGKTAVLHRLINGEHKDDHPPTNGVAVHQLNYKNTQFTVYDLSGHESNRNNWEQYYDSAEVKNFLLQMKTFYN